MTRTKAASVVAMSAAAALVLAACGGGGGGGGAGGEGGSPTATGLFEGCTDPNTCNQVAADQLQQGGQVTFAIEKNIDNWNQNSSEGNVFETGLVFKALLPYTFVTTPDLKSTLNTDYVSSAEVTSESPFTVTYTINPNASWNDGTPVNAEDFVFNWKTQNGRDCPDCDTPGNGGYDQIDSVVGSEGGKTVTVTYAQPYTDWQGVFGSSAPLYPAHIAAQQGDLTSPAGLKSAFDWFGRTVPTFSAGPYAIEDWQPNVALTVVPNPAWAGATKPKLDRLVYRVITDATQEPIALQNDEVQVIYPQPQVDLVTQVQQIPGVSQTQGLGLTWEHFDLNLVNPFLADKALRQAMFTAVNREDIIAKTVGQFNPEVTPLNNHMYIPQLEGYRDVIGPTGQGTGNLDAAKKILTDAGYTGVGTALVAPNGQAVPHVPHPVHRGQRHPAEPVRAVRVVHEGPGRERHHRTHRLARRHHQQRRLRHHRLRLGAVAVRVRRRAAALAVHLRLELRQVQQPPGGRADQPGGVVDRPGCGDRAAQRGRPDHGRGRLRAAALPEADVRRGPRQRRQRAQQLLAGRTDVQRGAVGPEGPVSHAR